MNRTSQVKSAPLKTGPVIYWMSRDQRIYDNWALIEAQNFAVESRSPLIILFNLADEFLDAGSRQFRFMIKGLEDVYFRAAELNIPFFILTGEPGKNIPGFIKDISCSALFTDFDPLRIKRKWLEDVVKKVNVPVFQVDAHNIVPAFITSQKQEFSAAHIRPKIYTLLPAYTEEFPSVKKMQNSGLLSTEPDFPSLLNKYKKKPGEVEWIKPGSQSAYSALEDYLSGRINNYEKKNDPNSRVVSDLSPFLHFGHLSAQRIMLEIQKRDLNKDAEKSFLDELIVRRELSDNYCLYNSDYDNFNGLPLWGKETLDKHKKDEREFLYSAHEFEKGKTHDPLWNAAQAEMVNKGKMHGYMRMYWCKKILEWSASPEEAQQTAIFLNDKYELDGRDPNGYAGVAWSIGGLHDRPFAERPVYGRVRYMNYNGCKRKFNVEEYIMNNSMPGTP